MNHEELLLNESQSEAVEASEGYVRVIAGAGSGKTRTLSMRYAWLVESLGILPSSLLCITFTNKAASQMRLRIRGLVPDEDTGVISTFHGLCNMILLEESHAIHYPKSFMVIDGSDIDQLLGIVYEERGLTSRQMTFAKARDMISARKLEPGSPYTRELIALSTQQLYEKYMQQTELDDILFYGYLVQQKKNFSLDYDDLICLTLHIFYANSAICKKWQERFEYIMIDEFQDIDARQYELMNLLSQGHHNLFVVGDPDQTIYTWRGANIRYLLDFDQHFVPCRTIYLNENYRSTPQILDCANTLINCNKNRLKKDLYTLRPSLAPVAGGCYESSAQEAAGLVERLRHWRKKGYALSDMAVLYRAHYLSRPLEEALLEAQIPYVIYSGTPFLSRMEIKDALAWCRMIVYKDDLDFLRTINNPRRNIGKSRIAFLRDYAQEHELSLYQALVANLETDRFVSTQAADYVELIENYQTEGKPISRILDEMLDLSGYEKRLRLEGGQQRLDNLAELKQAAAEFELSWGEDISLDDWLRHMALMSTSDREMEQDKVKLMTIHTAKGLEFPCVALMGMNEGVFPTRQTRTLEGMEEERRLAFVAITRARNELFVTQALGYLHTGAGRYPSRFALELGDSIVWDPPVPSDMAQATRRVVQMGNVSQDPGENAGLAPGDRVRHPSFGEGTVLETDSSSMRLVIQFDRLATRRTLSMKARLERIEKGSGTHVVH